MSVPYPMVLNYCASKAALHSFILSVREQLKFAKTPEGKIRLIEIVTPLVQSESLSHFILAFYWSTDR